jgi:hypothetical protein
MTVYTKETVEIDGQHYAGDWAANGELITVRLPGYGRKSTQLGCLPPQSLARLLLTELVNDMLDGKPSLQPDKLTETFGDKTCQCYKSDYRDPECQRDYPDICPWRAFDLMMLVGPLPRKSGH